MSTFATPQVVWRGATAPGSPLVVLLHGRGSNEDDIITLADHLPDGIAYAAVRAPITEGGGYAWFANRGIGRPVAESLTETMAWFRTWLDAMAPAGRPVVLVGFSGGAAFAGGLALDDPGRYTGAAILSGTLPFDAGVPTTPGRLAGLPVFVAHGDADTVIPADLLGAHLVLPARRGRQLHDRRPRPGRPRHQRHRARRAAQLVARPDGHGRGVVVSAAWRFELRQRQAVDMITVGRTWAPSGRT